MMSTVVTAAAVLSIWIALTDAARTQAAIEVRGLDGKSVPVSLADLPRQTVSGDDHGTKASFDGVWLRDVLARAGIGFGDKLRGPALSRYVVVSARDGYRVAFTLAELDTAFTGLPVLLADRRDGQPLSAEDGPLRLVVPRDQHASRWIRQVTRLDIREAPER